MDYQSIKDKVEAEMEKGSIEFGLRIEYELKPLSDKITTHLLIVGPVIRFILGMTAGLLLCKWANFWQHLQFAWDSHLSAIPLQAWVFFGFLVFMCICIYICDNEDDSMGGFPG